MNLSGADLEAANLAGSDLVHGRLSGANLSGANLSKARLDHADFDGADLTNANLSGASLHHVKNLSVKQLASARGSRTTILPPELQGKVPWSVPKDPASALHAEPDELPLPQPGPAVRVEVLDATQHLRPVFLVGALSAVAVVGLGLAGDQLSVGIMSGGAIPDRQVISGPVAGFATASATPDVSATPAIAPVAEVRVPPEEPAASGLAAEAARTVPAPPASRDRGPLEDEVALAPEAVETAMGPPRDRARAPSDLAGFATLPVRPAVLVAADVLAAGARLELGFHGLRPEGRGQITVRPALAPERPSAHDGIPRDCRGRGRAAVRPPGAQRDLARQHCLSCCYGILAGDQRTAGAHHDRTVPRSSSAPRTSPWQ